MDTPPKHGSRAEREPPERTLCRHRDDSAPRLSYITTAEGGSVSGRWVGQNPGVANSFEQIMGAPNKSLKSTPILGLWFVWCRCESAGRAPRLLMRRGDLTLC